MSRTPYPEESSRSVDSADASGATTRRIVLTPTVNAKALFTEPPSAAGNDAKAQREMVERINRLNFTAHFNYEDPLSRVMPTQTYDPSGDYRCGSCNKQNGDDDCLLIPINVDLQAGSCAHFEMKCASDRETDLSQIGVTAEQVGYGVAKNGEGFGCKRCPFGSTANEIDSVGRTLYCGKGDFRVFPTACCALNGAEIVSDYEENDPVASSKSNDYAPQRLKAIVSPRGEQSGAKASVVDALRSRLR